jgi:SAM-dependent methyltransferase
MPDQAEQVPYLEENLWGYGKRLKFVDDALQRVFPGTPRRNLTVLDIGCGNGSQLAIPLANAGYQVTAIDPHWPSIERGRSFASSVRFLHATASALPPGTFNCVVLSEVLEHLEMPHTLLEEALPYLEKSGMLVVTVPNGYGEFELDRRIYQALHLDKLVLRVRPLFRRDSDARPIAGSDCDSPHVQRFTLRSLSKLFEQHHLQLIEARATSLVSGPIVAHLLARYPSFIRLNAAIADRVSMPLAAGWMFLLQRPREYFTTEYKDVTQKKVSR